MKEILSIVMDLDGTLLNHYKDVSPYNQEAVQEMYLRGVVIGLASGRSAQNILDHLRHWHIEHYISFIIGSNGCEYLNTATGQRTVSHLLSYESLKKFQKENRDRNFFYGVPFNGTFYMNRFSMIGAAWAIANQMKPEIQNFEDLKDAKFSKIVILGSPKEIDSIFKNWDSENLYPVPTGKRVLEVMHPCVSKFTGLKQAMKDFGFSQKQVLSFGDDYNDIELLRKTNGVAMKNGVPMLEEISKAVTKYPGNQDGVAYHLNTLLLSDDWFFGKNSEEPEEEDYPDQGQGNRDVLQNLKPETAESRPGHDQEGMLSRVIRNQMHIFSLSDGRHAKQSSSHQTAKTSAKTGKERAEKY